MPDMQAVDSSLIQSIGHDGDALHIQFKGGQAYKYSGVPKETYDQMLGSPSAGQFFHKNINGKFKHAK